MIHNKKSTSLFSSKQSDGTPLTEFSVAELSSNESFTNITAATNRIIFMISGRCLISSDTHPETQMSNMSMILIAKGKSYSLSITSPSKLMIFSFETIHDREHRNLLESYLPLCRTLEYRFEALPIAKSLYHFLMLIEQFATRRVECFDFCEKKHNELFLTLRTFYSQNDLVELLHPVICKSLDFKNFILNNYVDADWNVNELIARSEMGSSTFYATFKEVFGITAKQWMLKQYATRIASAAAIEGASVNRIMGTLAVKSPCHFYRVCKQQFNCTPGQLIERFKTEKTNNNNTCSRAK